MTQTNDGGATDLTTDALKRLAKAITPGPWRVGPVDDTRVEDADGNEVAQIDGDYNQPETWPLMEANAEAIALLPALLRELIERREADGWRPTHRHVKRGTEYREVARGKLQTDVPLTDYAELVAYHDQNGNWWFRAPAEFDDGRFTTTEGDNHERE